MMGESITKRLAGIEARIRRQRGTFDLSRLNATERERLEELESLIDTDSAGQLVGFDRASDSELMELERLLLRAQR